MSDQIPSSNPNLDPYEQHLKIVRNPDGSITRLLNHPCTSAVPDPNHPTPVLSKDIPLNQSNKTWARIFLPRQALDNSSGHSKLPLVVFYHGGGFIMCSAATTVFHIFCANIAVEIPAVVVSVDYRLAPEHRLPAAYDDAMEALHLIKTTHDEWLLKYADFCKCYIMGSSAGSNIAYHLGLRMANESDDDLEPMKIQGLILLHPFFGGSERTGSEIRLIDDPVIPLCATDLMWELALPIGADRDHEYSNPMAGDGSHLIERIKLLRWKILVMGCDGDPLIDRQIGVARMLEEKGVIVVSQFREGDCHGIEVSEPSKMKDLLVVLKNFMIS